ncbi:MAG: hypothetical protein DRJ97_03640 [Thermoprotei archaeon]|nr:MAG: hypothetical protein DRJ97_03640 [Thermoprotei archaeon]
MEVKNVEVNDVEGRILEFLRSRRRGATARFIAVKVGSSLETVSEALNRLLTMKAIEKRGKFFRFRGRRRWMITKKAGI